jgi:hypothetical protein
VALFLYAADIRKTQLMHPQLYTSLLSHGKKVYKLDITERAGKIIAHGQQPPELLTLIPPLAEDFYVYGTPETLTRARSWGAS